MKQKCVYNYVVKNLKHILNLSVRELADEVHVSTATVMRFCKKMGYSGFSELKYKIKEFYEQQDQEDNYEINDIEGFVEHIKSNDYLDKLKINHNKNLVKNNSASKKFSISPITQNN